VEAELDQSHIRRARIAAGLSQSALGARAGVTRQAMNAIERGRYSPNTTVAIRIARTLGKRVEDLFGAPDEVTTVSPATATAEMRQGDRVALARVGERIVAHSRTADRSFSEAFAPADGIWLGAGSAELLADEREVEHTAFIVGCDPSLDLLARLVNQRLEFGRLVWIPGSSAASLNAVSHSTGHAGGIHVPDQRSGECNIAPAGKALRATGGVLVTYAAWEQGFVVRPANPKGITTAESLMRPGIRIVNRERGSGSRTLLDQRLKSDGIAANTIDGYGVELRSHFAVARAVASGGADAGIALRAVAIAEGLDFVPLLEVRFDLVIPQQHLQHPAIRVMLDMLQDARTRRQIGTLPGYETREAGVVRHRFEAAA
jgi:molybdate-binding protein/DNA-binding XRE family transcriptional regulator